MATAAPLAASPRIRSCTRRTTLLTLPEDVLLYALALPLLWNDAAAVRALGCCRRLRRLLRPVRAARRGLQRVYEQLRPFLITQRRLDLALCTHGALVLTLPGAYYTHHNVTLHAAVPVEGNPALLIAGSDIKLEDITLHINRTSRSRTALAVLPRCAGVQVTGSDFIVENPQNGARALTDGCICWEPERDLWVAILVMSEESFFAEGIACRRRDGTPLPPPFCYGYIAETWANIDYAQLFRAHEALANRARTETLALSGARTH